MPHSHPPSYVTNCRWDHIDKQHSRDVAIIELYRDIFQRQSVPDDYQFWSMCGAHKNKKGIIKGEFGHLTESQLITPEQYHGVDREKEIIDTNKTIYPSGNWYHGDFLEVMESHHGFKPAIINYDGIMQPKYGTKYLKAIMKFVDFNVEEELLLVSNFVLTNPYSLDLSFKIHDVLRELFSIYWLPEHWHLIPQAYEYRKRVNGGRGTVMGMIMFIKSQHSI